jgi:aminopeptidase N
VVPDVACPDVRSYPGALQIVVPYLQATSELLVGPDDVEGSVTSRLLLARGLAHQWFGSLLLPRTPEDSWVMEALASHLEDVFARKWLGQVRECSH